MSNYTFNLPDVGEGIAEVEISDWMVAVGDSVKEDDLLCVVLTDKAAVEIPSPVDGIVTWVGSEEGSTMAVGSKLVAFEVSAEDAEGSDSVYDSSERSSGNNRGAQATAQAVPVAPAAPAAAAAATVAATPATTEVLAASPSGARPIASPALRQRARDMGVDLRFVPGSGPGGRINHADLDAWLARSGQGRAQANLSSAAADQHVERIKVTGLRRKIGAIMQSTMQRIPHYSYVEEVDVTELEALRQRLNQQRQADQPKLTLLPFLLRGLVLALRAYPQIGSRYDDVEHVLEQHAGAHIGIATQTDAGLLVPVLRHAETLDLWQSASQLLALAEKARSGKATREELSGSTITISSLGARGGIVTTPVINAPEVAIIGVNKIATRPVWQDGAFIPRQIMNLSSSFDHRIIDGWEATQFIHHIKDLLECPANLFIPQPQAH